MRTFFASLLLLILPLSACASKSATDAPPPLLQETQSGHLTCTAVYKKADISIPLIGALEYKGANGAMGLALVQGKRFAQCFFTNGRPVCTPAGTKNASVRYVAETAAGFTACALGLEQGRDMRLPKGWILASKQDGVYLFCNATKRENLSISLVGQGGQR